MLNVTYKSQTYENLFYPSAQSHKTTFRCNGKHWGAECAPANLSTCFSKSCLLPYLPSVHQTPAYCFYSQNLGRLYLFPYFLLYSQISCIAKHTLS